MTMSFTGSELVEFAVQLEKNGLNFYATAADTVVNPKTKDLLHVLANDEIQHMHLFQDLLTHVGLADLRESYPGEWVTYLQAHVESQVFTAARMKQLLAQKTLSERDALQFGIDSEKDAILYYTEMMRFVQSADQKTVQGVIDEEKRHLTRLVGMMKDVAQPAA